VNNNPQVCESSIDPIVSYVTSNEVRCSGCMVPIIPQPKKQPMEQKLCETLCYLSVCSNQKKRGLYIYPERIIVFEIATFWLHFFELLLCLLM
jgi:hypothetical protein